MRATVTGILTMLSMLGPPGCAPRKAADQDGPLPPIYFITDLTFPKPQPGSPPATLPRIAPLTTGLMGREFSGYAELLDALGCYIEATGELPPDKEALARFAHGQQLPAGFQGIEGYRRLGDGSAVFRWSTSRPAMRMRMPAEFHVSLTTQATAPHMSFHLATSRATAP